MTVTSSSRERYFRASCCTSAGVMAKLVKGFAPVRITFRTAAKEVNAASMLALLSLGLKCGTEIEICAEGGDEAAAVKAVAAFIANMSE